jgi:hypothetical protein
MADELAWTDRTSGPLATAAPAFRDQTLFAAMDGERLRLFF